MFKKLNFLIPVFLALVLIVPSVIWVWCDRSVWPWDPSWYAEVTLDLFKELKRSPFAWLAASLRVYGFKAPAIAWLSEWFIPLRYLFGSVERALLTFILICQAGCLLLFYRIIFTIFDRDVFLSAFGTLFVAAGPLFIGLSHVFFVEPIQTLGIMWLILATLQADTKNPYSTCGDLVIAFNLAMTAKISTPLYCIGPALILVFHYWKNWRFKRFKFKSTEPTLLHLKKLVFAGLLTAWSTAWYLNNFKTVQAFVVNSTSSKTAELWGRRLPLFQKLQYWIYAFDYSYFLGWCGIVFSVSIVLALLLRIKGRRLADVTLGLVAVCVLQLLVTLMVFARQTNEETRYLLPLCPYVGIIAVWALSEIKTKSIVLANVLMTFALAHWLINNLIALNVVPYVHARSPWLTSANPDDKSYRLLEETVRVTCNPESKYSTNVIGTELASFNANSASFYRAKISPFVCYYTSLGLAEVSADKAWERMKELNVKYFITINPALQTIQDVRLNAINAEILGRVSTDIAFTRLESRDNSDLVYFIRTKPW